MLMVFTAFLAPALFVATPDILPPPQDAKWLEGTLAMPPTVTASAPKDWMKRIEPHLWILDETLKARGPFRIEPRADDPEAFIVIGRVRPTPGIPAAEYTLGIGPDRVRIGTPDEAGVFNALATLAQIIEQTTGNPITLPLCAIHDWPALPIRAVHIDLTCQQYTPAYVQKLMRTLARYKVNAILMEYSDMFPFRKHAAIRRPDAFSEDDIRAIRQTAAECNQELIPFLQCLGHLEYVLHRQEYAKYGASHNGYMYCPCDEATMPLVRELIDEILAQHPGIKYLHVGGDEVSPGKCERCLAYTSEHGFSSLYVKHYTQVASYCKQRGVIPLLWSDMVLQHPEALAELPRNVAWVVWDYSTTTDPAPNVWHGARMDKLDQLHPKYVEYFGEGIGLADARQRGGLTAFGHAPGFTRLGFAAFTAPAARCSGDNFDLPRFKLHAGNIRMAMLKAVAFKLPGSIITSWSYRGSSHEVCLPEYACAAYGWNVQTPDVDALLACFFRQRYGIADPALAGSIMAASDIVPPSTLARPTLDDHKRAWIVTPDTQLDQIERALQEDPDNQLRLMQEMLITLERNASLLHQAMANATRNGQELRHWDLAQRHLAHRLRLVLILAELRHAGQRNAALNQGRVNELRKELGPLAEQCRTLRQEWVELYRGILSPPFLETDLYTRFDTEKDITDRVLAGG